MRIREPTKGLKRVAGGQSGSTNETICVKYKTKKWDLKRAEMVGEK